MIEAIISWSLRNRFLVACAFILLMGFGIRAVVTTPVDAIPDLSENQVIVFADWMGRSPREVEDQVTYPLTTNLQGLGGVKAVRATSMFGFSLATVVFEDRVDNTLARQRVLERLNLLQGVLPAGVVPKLGPDATGLGWVYQYYLDVDPKKAPGGGYDLAQLRSLQDWFIRYQLQSVAGVAEVGSIGGFVKQYQIEVSPALMKSRGVTLDDVMNAVARANLNVGGKTIDENGQEFVVRGVGLIQSAQELESIAVMQRDGTPVYLRDIARIGIGGDFRRGTLDVDGREVVGGTVVMRTGENAHEVIARVKDRIATLQGSLPAGVTIKPFYDRSELIDRTIGTLKHALTEEVLLVTLAHIVFLFHFRSIAIVTIPLPASILGAFILMNVFGISSNIMSLCGIAIAIGVLVDAAIVITENVIRHCEEEEDRVGRGNLTPADYLRLTHEAARQVGRPIFFAMAIILLAFIPIFALEGQEGKMFHPLAFTKTFAMAVSTLLAITVVPVLCSLWVRGPFHREERNIVMRTLMAIYDPALRWALAHRKAVIGIAAMILGAAAVVWFGLPRAWVQRLDGMPVVQRLVRGFGEEFMPPLNEGSLLFMPTLVPATSLSEVQRVMAWQDRVIRETPEVVSVAGKLGRAETATDPAPTEMIETTIMLKPASEWRPGMTKDKLIAELQQRLSQVPGFAPGFLQPIENRILMISTGIRAQLGVKILGDDLDALQRIANDVQKVVQNVPGATGVVPSLVQGKPYLEIRPRRTELARYGLTMKDVLDHVETGLGGMNLTTTIEGRERIPIQLRVEQGSRDDLTRIGDLLVSMPAMKPGEAPLAIPLGMLADIVRVSGPNEIASENGRLRSFVQANVDTNVTDLGTFVRGVKAAVAREIAPHLPPGVTIEYAGEYENKLRADKALRIAAPSAVLVIFMLLYLVYRNAKEALHVILAVPFALSGGVFLQYLLGFSTSTAVKVGYIALFGTAIQTGVVMVVYLEEALRKKRAERGAAFNEDDLRDAVIAGAKLRLRPKVMTVATAVMSLLPIFWSQRTGAEVMQPIAAPVVGGMLSSLVHILIVTPVIFYWLRRREMRKGQLVAG